MIRKIESRTDQVANASEVRVLRLASARIKRPCQCLCGSPCCSKASAACLAIATLFVSISPACSFSSFRLSSHPRFVHAFWHLAQELASMDDEMERLRTQINDQQEKLSCKDKELAAIKQDMADLESKKLSAEQLVSDLQKASDDLRAAQGRMQQQHLDFERQISSMTERQMGLEEDSKALAGKDAEVEELKQQLAHQEKQMKYQLSQNANLLSDRQEQVDSLRAEVAELKTAV